MVDFEKAFDTVARSFIEKSLRKFKFGKDITRWILTFYTNINSCVHVNGQYSQWFDVKEVRDRVIRCLFIYFLFVQNC